MLLKQVRSITAATGNKQEKQGKVDVSKATTSVDPRSVKIGPSTCGSNNQTVDEALQKAPGAVHKSQEIGSPPRCVLTVMRAAVQISCSLSGLS